MILNPSIFLLKPSDFPGVPTEFSDESKRWWIEQRRRCIEGYWAGGRYMPPHLYFYVNFWPILLNKNRTSKVKEKGFPRLWDILWDISYAWMEARGFAGFEKTPGIKELEAVLLDPKSSQTDIELAEAVIPNPRETLRSSADMGKPKYLLQAKDLMWLGNRGHGKDLHEDTILYYEDGEKPIKDVKLGDRIYGSDGKLTTIISRKDFTDQLQYRVTLSDKREIVCGGGHLWYVKDYNKHHRILETDVLFRDFQRGKYKKYFIPMQEAIEYPEKQLPMDPYTVGALLGDGGMAGSNVVLTTSDPEIISYIPYTVKKYSGTYAYGLIGINSITKELGMRVSSLEKHIPRDYLYGSVKQRMNLLQGLMDTDGSVHKDGKIEFSTSSSKLKDDFIKLVRGLGIRVSYTKRSTTNADSYRIYLITSLPVFRLKRKAERLNNRNKPYGRSLREWVSISKIEPVSVLPSVCIGVDNENHLFQAGDNIVTHNSYFMAGAVIAHEWLFDGIKEYIPMSQVKSASEVVVGAWDSKYSSLTLQKVAFGLDNLPGALEVGTELYPSPLSRLASGSFDLNDDYKYEYRKKVGNNWKKVGTKSTIKHRSFKNNDYAASGTRPTVMALDEIGLFPNLDQARIHSTDTMMNQQRKFGSALYTGTGGDMDSGTIPASRLFYGGEDMVLFEDTYEHKGKIGLFIPATLGSEDFKDAHGNTRLEEAQTHFEKKRERIRMQPNGIEALDGEKQNQPLVPSEMFLTRSGNLFPRAELQEHLSRIEANPSYERSESIGEFIYDEEGLLKFLPLPPSRAIKVFPHDQNKHDIRGAIVIWEPPVKVDGKVPYGLYVMGCLTKGEKVLTNAGLKNVEDVTLEDKLINKDGEYVGINALLSYDKINEPIYKVDISYVDRPTIYTHEHPLYVSDNVESEFTFKRVRDVKEGMWIKYPNIYNKEVPIDLNRWDKYNFSRRAKIDNPLEKEDFWWFVGHWLGDGFNNNVGRNYTIYNSFGIAELEYLNKYKDIVDKIFGRVPHHKSKNGSNTHKFESIQLYCFLEENFGKHAGGKYIPEWVKFLPKKYKLQLILGYIDSDGSIFKDRKNIRLSFKSINKTLLHDIQDILFSLGIISRIQLSTKQQYYNINGKVGLSKDCYSLNVKTTHLHKLASYYAFDYNSRKLRLAKTITIKQKHPNLTACIVSEDNKYIYLKISKITKDIYTGKVYNFDCETHSFICQYCAGHNCDPYDHDDSGTQSLGSTFVFKKILTAGTTSFWPVAEYTGRHERGSDAYYEQARRLSLYYGGATTMFENNLIGMYKYYLRKNATYLLMDVPEYAKEESGSQPNRPKGMHFGTKEIKHGERLIKEYLEEEYAPGMLNLLKIRSVPLLKELIMYNKEGNFDRVRAFMACMYAVQETYMIEAKPTKMAKTLANDPFFTRTYNTANPRVVDPRSHRPGLPMYSQLKAR